MTPASAWDKISAAKRESVTVFVSAMAGYGKTALVSQLLLGKTCGYVPVPDMASRPDFSRIPFAAGARRKTPLPVVFDDVQFVTDADDRAKIVEIASRPDVWSVFLSRAPLADWLVPLCSLRPLCSVGEGDLALSVEQFDSRLRGGGIHLSAPQLAEAHSFVRGSPLGIRVVARALESAPFSPSIRSDCLSIFADFTIHGVVSGWSAELQDFMMRMGVPGRFSQALAERVVGAEAARLVPLARSVGGFLVPDGGELSIRPVPLEAFRRMARVRLGAEEIRRIAFACAEWFEENGRLVRALELYSEAGRTDRIRSVLVMNSSQSPSNGLYFALSRWYFELPEEEVASDVVLMSGMAMVCSISLMPEESELWYERLRAASRGLSGADRAAARRHLAYLDIALPHRGSATVLDSIRSVGTMIVSRGSPLPEFCVTSNLPSTMNGGKDFCGWSLRDREIERLYGGIITLVLGRNGKGLRSLALGESLFEKAADREEVLSLLSRGQVEAATPEMSFVAAGLLARFYASEGQMDAARAQLDSFDALCADAGETKFAGNAAAARCRLDLLAGESSAVEKWLAASAPDENVRMNAMLRLQYMAKVRAYISLGRLVEARSLLEKMTWYAERYKRTYISFECGILMAVVRFRMGGEGWRGPLLETLRLMGTYRFVRVVAEEGCAILPLLRSLSAAVRSDSGIETEWFRAVVAETERSALFYPQYMRAKASAGDFSELAISVLRLQAEGLSATQIAERLSMNAEAVRYHIKRNYKKLGATGKTDAIMAARTLRLL